MPNDAHLHLILVHGAPAFIWSSLILFLFARWFPREGGLRVAALSLVLIATVGLVLSANTGEGAADLLHDVPTVAEERIHEHEEMGELAFPLALGSAFMALVWFTLARKDQRNSRGWSWWAALLLLLATAGVATYTGNLGGRIRHPEAISGWEPGTQETGSSTDGDSHETHSHDEGEDEDH